MNSVIVVSSDRPELDLVLPVVDRRVVRQMTLTEWRPGSGSVKKLVKETYVWHRGRFENARRVSRGEVLK